jgi:3-hydroxyacyl-CoA dehydrogenase
MPASHQSSFQGGRVREIRKVAVLGAGTMGARIAAHVANAGVPSMLLDIVPPGSPDGGASAEDPAEAKLRSRLAASGIEAALRSRPPAFFIPENARLITPGNFEDHLALIKDSDWIIEAIVENRKAKQALLEKVEAVRSPGSIVSSNTSGISISSLAAGRSEDFQRHFLGTHFFNPPRYMKLLEIIPTADTERDVTRAVGRFGDAVLGKGIVTAKDTPNFIANRIGTFITMNVLRAMEEGAYTIEEIDALTGPAMGLPKSATFRTLDMVGLDVLIHVVTNLAASLHGDERADLFRIPDFVRRTSDRGLLGEKTGGGFYKKTKGPGGESEILALDLKTFEYRPRQKPKFASLEMAWNIENNGERVAMLFKAPDRAGEFYRKVLPDMFHYAASRVPEIADDVVSIDNAIKWGFNWQSGLFELWDTIGVSPIVETWKQEGRALPPLVDRLLAAGKKTFYSSSNGTISYFDFESSRDRNVEKPSGMILLPALKETKKEVRRNAGASLVDLGHGVLCLEFHSKMNTIGADAVAMIHAGLKTLNEGFDAMIIGNQGRNFSAGADLMLVLMTIQEQEWDDLHQAVRAFQNANMALKYAPKPVVAAPHGLTLGGGVEISLHAARVRAAAETYMGLVEAGVGLIPAGGGTKEMLVRAMDSLPSDPEADPFTYLKEVFMNIATARASSSAAEARRLGYLAARDSVSMNRDRQIADAKQVALDLAKLGYRPGEPREDVLALGQPAYSKLKLGIHLAHRAGQISDHDVVIGTALAKVLTGGGEFTSSQRVSEQYLLDLEREAFVSLCGEKRTQERIQHMLKKGKALRN